MSVAPAADRSPDRLPLEGMRVIEVGQGVAGAFASKWLAALGAEVIGLEGPGGRFERAGDGQADDRAPARRIYLDTGKRSAALDPEAPADRTKLEALTLEADVLIDAGALLEPAALRARAPGLVIVRITPFGSDGPYARLPATSLTIAAQCGMLWHVGEPGRAPLAQPYDQPEYLVGLHALAAALTGYWAALETGRGALFDLSVQAVGAAAIGHYTARTSQTGDHLGRLPPRALWRLYEATDGWAGICALARNFGQLADAMGLPELADVSPFMDGVAADERRRITALLCDWFAPRRCRDIQSLARERGVPLGTVRSIGDLLDSDQLRERDFFAEERDADGRKLRYPGQLWVGSETSWRRRPAPAPGADEPRFETRRSPREALDDCGSGSGSAGGLPLDGLRVLELGQIWAGPYAAMLLADQGADVIKIESPKAWDPNRCAAPPPPGHEAKWWDTCAYYHEYNRNKRAVSLDLRQPRGRALFAQLARSADVVIENFRSDTLDRLGVGYAWLCEQNPRIVLVSMAGFGQTGPERAMAGYGPLIEQASGLAGLTGYGDGRPQLVEYAYGDPVAAVAAAAATLTALIQRRRSGRGQHIDLAQRDVTVAMLGEAFVERCTTGEQPAVRGNRHARMAPHGVYRCAGEDEWVAIAVEDDEQWRGLRAAMGDPAWARATELAGVRGRRERHDELDERMTEWARGLTKREVSTRCREHAVAAGPVWNDHELLEDPQLAARGFYEPIAHPAVGEWRTHGWEWRAQGSGRCVRSPAPGFGQHNAEVLGGELGLSDAELAALEAEAVISREPFGVPPLPGADDGSESP